jgi:hypothetical protein
METEHFPRVAERAVSYEPPSLTPMGSVSELLGNTTGSSCDAQVGNPGSGNDPNSCV